MRFRPPRRTRASTQEFPECDESVPAARRRSGGGRGSRRRDVAGLRGANLLNRHATDHRGERREYEWVTDLPLNGNPDSPLINFIQFRIVKAGKVTYQNAWVTDIVPTADNIVGLVRAARARWKIENEGFNTLKNHGYHLEHNFGHGHRHLSEAFLRAQPAGVLHAPDL